MRENVFMWIRNHWVSKEKNSVEKSSQITTMDFFKKKKYDTNITVKYFKISVVYLKIMESYVIRDIPMQDFNVIDLIHI